MAKALTTKAVEAAKPDPKKRIERPDPALSGLYLVIQPSGAKSWALRYRHEGTPRKLTLGRWPAMQVAAARKAASAALEAVEKGEDPAGEKQAAKAQKVMDRDTIANLVELYAQRHLAKLRTGAEVRRRLEVEVLPHWGERTIQEITRRDVRDLLDEVAASGRAITANRLRAYLSGFFNWAVEREVIEIAPTLGVKPVVKERSRERVLTDDEIRWFWEACGALDYPWGALGRFLLLTGQRLGEVAGLTQDEIDGNTWRLSGLRTKNGRAHDVPLTGAALGALQAAQPGGAFVFTTTGTTPLGGFQKGKLRLAAEMRAIASRERGEPVEIAPWTWHDLRRTAATGMARIGIPVRVTEAVLNHVSGTAGGIVGVYQLHQYQDEKRQALEAWERWVAGLIDGGVDNVVRIRGA